MKNLIKDFLIFIKSLDFIDVLFIVSIIGLVILIVTLIYIIKINDDDLELIDGDIDEVGTQEDDDEELDLAKISKEIDESPARPIVLNDYEKEQEEKAIISYDELLKTKDLREEINYIKEEELGDLKIKSVDMKELTKPIELPKIKEEYKKLVNLDDEEEKKEMEVKANNVLISYEKEEEFLQALKKLQRLLN